MYECRNVPRAKKKAKEQLNATIIIDVPSRFSQGVLDFLISVPYQPTYNR